MFHVYSLDLIFYKMYSFCLLLLNLFHHSPQNFAGIKKGRYSLERKQDYLNIVEKIEQEEKKQEEDEIRRKESHKKKIADTIERLKFLNDKHRIVTPEVVERVKKAEQEKRVS